MSTESKLDQLKMSAVEKLQNKKNGKIRFVVCYTSCSIAVGANEVLSAMQEYLAATHLENIIIETTGCMGICSKEVLVDVYSQDDVKYSYENMTPTKARAIIASHALLGKPVNEWLLKS